MNDDSPTGRIHDAETYQRFLIFYLSSFHKLSASCCVTCVVSSLRVDNVPCGCSHVSLICRFVRTILTSSFIISSITVAINTNHGIDLPAGSSVLLLLLYIEFELKAPRLTSILFPIINVPCQQTIVRYVDLYSVWS